jgi:tetratricopeptide (TPR) repeat protein
MPARPATLEGVFDRLREEASPRRGTEGRQLVALGHTYLAAGMVEAAIETFRKATLDGEARALAAMALSETYDELEDPAQALEWLEHGADAQESPETERLDAMRRLAEALDRGGEPERALAVWLEVATLRPQDPQAARAVTRLSGEQRRS